MQYQRGNGLHGTELSFKRLFGDLYVKINHSDKVYVVNSFLVKKTNKKTYDSEKKKKKVIETFSRFPHRNEILGRKSTKSELEFLKLPGSKF